jgi:uncharacterized protein YprB with RNaseH-like and TPR domain
VSALVDRLRGVVGSVSGATPPGVSSHAESVAPRLSTPRQSDHAAEALGGEWREAAGQRFLVVDRKYAPGHRHGQVAVCDAAPGDLPWPQLHLLAGGAQVDGSGGARKNLLFVDLETTGLAGGAGTYAFLVGCGWFDGGSFRVRQFFLSAFGAERVLLDAVSELASGAAGVVTYNGKSFDLPLIETRYLLHRMTTPFAALPHVDMLHPARRLWRSEEQEGCRLMELETTLLGHEREGDVPGFEIPARYFNFVRSGDARPLEPVLEHNRLDLLSLALVTARAAQLLDEGPAAARTAREALGMGRLFERGMMLREASACYWRGLELPGDPASHAENLRAYAVLARRQRRFADAADGWRRALELRRCPPHIVREATEALAVHHEHRVRDLAVARQFALQSLPLQSSASRRDAMQHRLARLSRKMGSEPTEALF